MPRPLRSSAATRASFLAALALSIASVFAATWLYPRVFVPPGSVPISPPAVYTRWWRMVESCSGRTGDLSAIRWYRAPHSYFTIGHLRADGVFMRVGNRIVIAAPSVTSGPTVRHEMLHALVAKTGHPREYFLGRCAALVECSGDCLKDGGPWLPPKDYDLLPSDSLEVRLQSSLLPPEADGTRWVEEWIEVRNPRRRPVLVASPRHFRTPPTFQYSVHGDLGKSSGFGSGLAALDSSAIFFAPLETKRQLFEFRAGSAFAHFPPSIVIPPGVYEFHGAYAGHFAVPETLSVLR